MKGKADTTPYEIPVSIRIGNSIAVVMAASVLLVGFLTHLGASTEAMLDDAVCRYFTK